MTYFNIKSLILWSIYPRVFPLQWIQIFIIWCLSITLQKVTYKANLVHTKISTLVCAFKQISKDKKVKSIKKKTLKSRIMLTKQKCYKTCIEFEAIDKGWTKMHIFVPELRKTYQDITLINMTLYGYKLYFEL